MTLIWIFICNSWEVLKEKLWGLELSYLLESLLLDEDLRLSGRAVLVRPQIEGTLVFLEYYFNSDKIHSILLYALSHKFLHKGKFAAPVLTSEKPSHVY